MTGWLGSKLLNDWGGETPIYVTFYLKCNFLMYFDKFMDFSIGLYGKLTRFIISTLLRETPRHSLPLFLFERKCSYVFW